MGTEMVVGIPKNHAKAVALRVRVITSLSDTWVSEFQRATIGRVDLEIQPSQPTPANPSTAWCPPSANAFNGAARIAYHLPTLA